MSEEPRQVAILDNDDVRQLKLDMEYLKIQLNRAGGQSVALDTAAMRRITDGVMKLIEWDDPEYDGTDAAHPAWWRGNDAGVLTTCQIITKALDLRDDGQGVFGCKALTEVRDRVLRLARIVAGSLVDGESQ